jgi:hypothetical protein
MQKYLRGWTLGLLLAGGLTGSQAASGGFAVEVIQYEPGVDYATDWQTGEGYTLPESALGAPSRVTVDPNPQFGGTFPVTPFAAPYLRSQLVSLGTGGSLTVKLAQPAENDPGHPYGIDFQIFGSAAFKIVNGDYTGGGITDGSLFGAAEPGSTRVEVSPDNETYYLLNPSLAPVVDGLFPTDGQGDFSIPGNPALTAADFDQQGLEGIHELYAGSAGGTGFDLAWAQDADGNPVALDAIQFVRVSVLSGHAEVDAFALVPEPSTTSLLGLGLVWLLAGRRRQ